MTTASTSSPAAASTSGERIFNFSAGPAVLPESVLRQAQSDLWNIDGSGIGILEHSHRGKVFDRVIAEAEADCRAVGGISDDYAVLFLQGGASMQFGMVPMCFMHRTGRADYVHTGVWTRKAIKDAKLSGDVHLAFDGSACNFDHVPGADECAWSDDAAYAWYCSNNTIYGTEFTTAPDAPAPLVCDASSDIFSRPIDVARHGIIFAGAQKNLGPAGCALVIIRRDLLGEVRPGLPAMLDYSKHADKGSRLNTPPSFAIYLMGRVFRWILDEGGLSAMHERNAAKAKIIYDAIDGSGGFFTPVARAESRSLMNITFRCPTPEQDAAFIAEAQTHDMSGLKGHRDVGGLRASTYNAFPAEGCTVLAQFMAEFAKRNG